MFWRQWQARRGLYHSLHLWWDLGKRRIKELSIKFCADRRKAQRKKRVALQNLIARLKASLDSGDSTQKPDYDNALNSLSLLYSAETKAAEVRSRALWVEEGETSSAFFLRLEKQHHASKMVDLLQLANGQFVSDTPDLLQAWEGFYSSLFTSIPTDEHIQDSFLDSLERVLSPDESRSCEGLLTSDECHDALAGMSNNKSPGLDGLPKEFYATFWPLLGADLVAVLNTSFHVGFLSTTMRRGIISLIFKKNERFFM
jgi:hypothetical protein